MRKIIKWINNRYHVVLYCKQLNYFYKTNIFPKQLNIILLPFFLEYES